MSVIDCLYAFIWLSHNVLNSICNENMLNKILHVISVYSVLYFKTRHVSENFSPMDRALRASDGIEFIPK